jgi:predicted amidohydrolase YtcJ
VSAGRPLLLRGGVVYSPADPFATAMVVDRGLVVWVGSDSAADVVAGPGIPVVDLRGALVTPAFVDAHVHLTDTGLARSGVDLSTVRSPTELLDRVAAAALARPGRPVLGHGWDDTDWTEPPPDRPALDRAAGDAPMYLSRVDVHSALVSSALLDAIPGITELDGFAVSGLLRRDAHHRARRASRDMLTPGQRRELQHDALTAAAALGIGQVHEMAAPHIAGLDDLALLLDWTPQAGDVPAVVGYWGELLGVDAASAVGARGCAGDLCIDGSLGSQTAALSTGYHDDPGVTGRLYLGAEQVEAHVVACTEAGLQAGFHCIGDAAVETAVEGLEAAARALGAARVVATGHRLEHVEMIDGDLAGRLAALGVVASVQPAFDAAWGGADGMYARRLGADRAGTLNPFATLARVGVGLAFGSDSPVTAFDPWGAVRAAAEHRTPAHRVTARAAFSAHTRGGWRAAGAGQGGVLSPGAPADYAVWELAGDLVVQAPDDRVAAWSTDPRSGVPGLPDLAAGAPAPRCLQTVVGGRTIFAAEDSATRR